MLAISFMEGLTDLIFIAGIVAVWIIRAKKD